MRNWGEFLGGFSGKRCVFIPTASNGDFMEGVQYGIWKSGETAKMIRQTGMEIEFMNLEEIGEHHQLATVCSQCDVIFVMGGACGYLMYWMIRRGLDTIIPQVLNKGVSYAGSSAGSMVCSPTLSVAEWYSGEPERGANLLPGLNLVPFDIFPHYEESLLPEIKSQYNGSELYLLTNDEAIEVVDDRFVVRGERKVITSN